MALQEVCFWMSLDLKFMFSLACQKVSFARPQAELCFFFVAAIMVLIDAA